MNTVTERLLKLPQKALALMVMELNEKLHEARAAAEPVAVVGMACRLPGGSDTPDAFWRFLRSGAVAVAELPKRCWAPSASSNANPGLRFGCCLEDPSGLDAEFFGLSAADARALDPQHRLVLELSWEALEAGGQRVDSLMASRTGIFLGLSSHDYADRQMRERGDMGVDVAYGLGTAPSLAAGRLAYLLGCEGPAIVVDTACSSSLVALHLACQSLRTNECNLAITGGAQVMLAAETALFLADAGVLSQDGVCRPFDAAASGYVRGEGAGIIVLKRLQDALRDRDRIHALIAATGLRQDGQSNGLKAPNGRSLEALIGGVLTQARWQGHEVDYVEAHGSGTTFGDMVEATALGRVYSVGRSEPLLLGSSKPSVGHLEAAAGIANVIKTILALERAEIPGTPNFERPNPHIPFGELRLAVNSRLTPWPSKERPRRAAVNGLSWCGTNAHVLLEQAPLREPVARAPAERALLALSARSQPALAALASRCADWLELDSDLDVRDVCHTFNVRRAPQEYRLVAFGSTASELAVALKSYLRGEARNVTVGRASKRRRSLIWAFCPTETTAAPLDRVALDRLAGDRRQLLEAASASHSARLLAVLLQIQAARAWQALGLVPTTSVGWGHAELAAAHIAGALDEDTLWHLTLSGSDEASLPQREPACRVAWLSPAATQAEPNASWAAWYAALDEVRHEASTLTLLKDVSDGPVLFFGARRPNFAAERWVVAADSCEPEARLSVIAELFVAGHEVDWKCLYGNGELLQAPTYPWQRRSHWYESLSDEKGA